MSSRPAESFFELPAFDCRLISGQTQAHDSLLLVFCRLFGGFSGRLKTKLTDTVKNPAELHGQLVGNFSTSGQGGLENLPCVEAVPGGDGRSNEQLGIADVLTLQVATEVRHQRHVVFWFSQVFANYLVGVQEANEIGVGEKLLLYLFDRPLTELRPILPAQL